jgi:hypothetical protein
MAESSVALRRESTAPTSLPGVWFTLAAPAVAWTLGEILGYVVVGRYCQHRTSGLAAYFVPAGPLVATILSAAMGLLTAIALVLALRTLRALGERPDAGGIPIRADDAAAPAIETEPTWGRARFTALAAALVSGLLLLNMIYWIIMPFLVDPCATN